MPEEVSRRWTERFGRRVFEGYGLTECSPFAAYNDAVEHRFGSVGRAVRDFAVAIHDEQGREVPRGEWGEIVIRGPGVMAGYWNRPKETEEALRGGWLHSGDIGRMDDDGYVVHRRPREGHDQRVGLQGLAGRGRAVPVPDAAGPRVRRLRRAGREEGRGGRGRGRRDARLGARPARR